MDIAASIAAITAALGLVKELKEIDASFDKAEMKLKLAELTGALADAKLGIIDAQDEVASRNKEIERLTAHLKFRDDETVVLKGYRYHTEAGEPKGRPYCPICEESGSLIRTITSSAPGHPITCPKCKSVFGYVAHFAE